MQSLEAAYEEGEVTPSLCDCLFKMVCTHNRSFKKAKLSTQRSSLSTVLDNVPTYNDSPHSSSACSTTTTTPQKPQFCIHTKLLELYLEESAKDPNQLKTGLKRNTHLLEKLVARERLNTIILNLYPGNKGYSITFPTSPLSDNCTIDDTADMIESKTWPYEDTELLHYLNLEELPAFIVDLLEPAHSFLFYSGCIIAKVRDYRRAFPTLKCDIHHVLLRPTAQSILADVQNIADEWTADDKAQLESRILLAHHPTLCLDAGTSHSMAARTSRLHHNRHLLNTHRIRRAAMKYSQVTVNRKKKLMSHTYRPGLELFEYLTRARTRPKSGTPLFAKSARREEVRPIPAPSLDTVPTLPPTGGVNITEFKAYSPAREFRESGDAGFPQFIENCQPQLVEEYVLETDMHSKEPDKRRVYQMKLSILQRPLNGEYLGELYLDRDHKKGERNGVASRFSLGTRVQANRYIQQFTEIFTESGRKSVRVNYCFAQNHPQVCFKVQNPPAPQVVNAQPPLTPQPNYSLSYQTLPGTNTVVNGTVNLVPAQQTASASVPLLQAQLQTNKQPQDANSEHAFSVLATKLMNSVQQIQAANAKQATQKSTCSNAAIINILNRSPASNINNDANAAVVNAINNSQLLAAQQQQQTVQTKLVGRKITVANMPANARVLNAANVISVNNNRSMADGTLHAPQQQITLTTVAGNNFFTTVTVPKPTARSNNDGGKAALSALLVGTAAADRPDISPANTNSLLLEKLAGVSSSNKNSASPTFIQSPKQYVAQSPKISPLANPPPQTQTINLQGLNYTTIQGLQGVQVQLPGFAQPMRAFLNVSSTGGLQGQSLLVSVPVTTTANSAGGGSSQCVNNNNSSIANSISVGNMGTSTVVLATNTGTSNLDVAQQVQKQFQHQQVQLQLNQQQFHQQTTPQPQHIHLNKIARRSSQNVSDPP